MEENGVRQYTDKMKFWLKKIEHKGVKYFQSHGEDIYTRFVRRMLVVLAGAGILAGIIAFVILLFASISKPLTKVPDVRGLDVIQASLDIGAAGLVVEIDGKYDSDTERYMVLDQFPKKGVTVKKGRTIKLLISMGKDEYLVPALVGKSRQEAETLLKNSHIPYELSEIQSDEYTLNSVTAQSIDAGRKADRSIKLKLIVNADVRKNEFRVQDYVRRPIDVVAQELLNGSINPLFDKMIVSKPEEDGLVMAQSISSNTVVTKNSDIRLQVGVYCKDDKEKQYMQYRVFSFVASSQAAATADDPLGGGQKTGGAPMPQNIRIVVTDEFEQKQVVLDNKVAQPGELVIVTWKSMGKSKLSLMINNNFVKEESYE